MKKEKKAGFKMDIVQRNIVILFDNPLMRQFIQLIRQINERIASDIVLNEVSMIPHMTLYTTNFPKKNEEVILEKLQHLSQEIYQFPVVFSQPPIDMLGVWINAKKSSELQEIHAKIVDGLSDLREGLYDVLELAAIGDNEGRKQSLFTNGMWAAKDLYIPHVTLSRPIDSSLLKEARKMLPEKIHFKTIIKEIAYGERGPFGTCKKILQKFPLLSFSAALN